MGTGAAAGGGSFGDDHASGSSPEDRQKVGGPVGGGCFERPRVFSRQCPTWGRASFWMTWASCAIRSEPGRRTRFPDPNVSGAAAHVPEGVRSDVAFGEELPFATLALASRAEELDVDLRVVEARHRPAVQAQRPSSRDHVYIARRLKLLSLPEAAKKALRSGELLPSIALLVARIPDRELAEKAANERSWGEKSEPMSQPPGGRPHPREQT